MPNGRRLYEDVLQIISHANQPIEKDLRPNNVKHLNEFLQTVELTEEQIEAKVKLAHPQFDDYCESRKSNLLRRAHKLPKLTRCPETRMRYIT